MSDESPSAPTPPNDPPAAPPPPPNNPPAPPPVQPPSSPPPSGKVSENRKIFLVLAYLGPLALIPWLVEKEDKEVQWHAKNGMLLFAAGFVFWLIVWAANSLLLSVLGCLGLISLLVILPLSIANFILHIVCIVKALKGERMVIPYLSDYVDQIPT